jgi:hypothetical protein
VDLVFETKEAQEAVKTCADIVVQGWDSKTYCELTLHGSSFLRIELPQFLRNDDRGIALSDSSISHEDRFLRLYVGTHDP